MRITSEASLHGFYRKPRVSKNYLAKHAEGLIGFSGCLAGELCQQPDGRQSMRSRQIRPPVSTRTFSAAATSFWRFKIKAWNWKRKIHADLFRLEKELGIPLVATNDSHYLCEDDHHAHEVLLCVQTADSIHNPKRFKFDTDQFYVKSAATRWNRLFSHAPEVVSRTMQFAERCNVQAQQGNQSLSGIRRTPPATPSTAILLRSAAQGFRKRLDTTIRVLGERGLRRQPKSRTTKPG